MERSRNVRGPHFSLRPPARSSQPSCELSPSALPRTRPRSNSARDAGVGPQQAFPGRASTAVCDTLSLPEHGAHRRTRAKTAMRPILATPMGRWVRKVGPQASGRREDSGPGPGCCPTHALCTLMRVVVGNGHPFEILKSRGRIYLSPTLSPHVPSTWADLRHQGPRAVSPADCVLARPRREHS